jgi:hypothetical protein
MSRFDCIAARASHACRGDMKRFEKYGVHRRDGRPGPEDRRRRGPAVAERTAAALREPGLSAWQDSVRSGGSCCLVCGPGSGQGLVARGAQAGPAVQGLGGHRGSQRSTSGRHKDCTTPASRSASPCAARPSQSGRLGAIREPTRSPSLAVVSAVQNVAPRTRAATRLLGCSDFGLSRRRPPRCACDRARTS